MSYNFVDSDLIEINNDLKLQISEIGESKHQIIIIDNFLKNPEDLLSIVESFPLERNSNKQSGFGAGWHCTLPLKLHQIKQTSQYLALNNYNMSIPNEGNPHDSIHLQINLLKGGLRCNYTSMVPHIDDAKLAFSIFLNRDEDCMGGTMFYAHKKSGIDYQIGYLNESFSKSDEYWKIYETYRRTKKHDYEIEYDSRLLDEDDEWEKTFLIESRYNRFIMYPSYLFHSAYVEKEWYQEKYRVSVAGFIK
jgi:hypothetical protein